MLSRGGVIDNIRTVEDAETRISAGFEVHKDVDIEGTYHGEEYGSPADGGQVMVWIDRAGVLAFEGNNCEMNGYLI